MGKLRLEVEPGRRIDFIAAEAQGVADAVREEVRFSFNSVECVAVPGGSADKLVAGYQMAASSSMIVRSDDSGPKIELRDEF